MINILFVIIFIMLIFKSCISLSTFTRSYQHIRFIRSATKLLSVKDDNNLLPSSLINTKIKKSESKVVDTIDCNDIPKGTKLVICRCWKSEKFPYCDGAHAKHNNETGDNIGPLIVKN